MRFWIATCLVVAVALTASATDALSAVDGIHRAQQLTKYMRAASESLGAEQVDALMKIKDEDRRYLAMTYYLHAGKTIASRWSWTSEQIKAYEQSAEYAEALTEIEKVAACFTANNPQYRLYVNTKVRSLEEQLQRWETVRSIGVAASALRNDALTQLALEAYAVTPDEASIQRFRQFLSTWRASHQPTLAAPGLSLHGQGRAYDFQIRDNKGHTIADTDSSTIDAIWDAQGWTKKLSTAVNAGSDKFIGPLSKPREPWHYEYRPNN